MHHRPDQRQADGDVEMKAFVLLPFAGVDSRTNLDYGDAPVRSELGQ